MGSAGLRGHKLGRVRVLCMNLMARTSHFLNPSSTGHYEDEFIGYTALPTSGREWYCLSMAKHTSDG